MLGAILATQDALDVETATTVTSFVSDLIGLKVTTDESTSSDLGAAPTDPDVAAAQQAAASIHNAVVELARAVVSAPGGGEVALRSANLNLTTESRAPAELTARPIACDSLLGEPASVNMPAGVLDVAPTVNASQPVSVVLYTVPALHPAPHASRDPREAYGADERPAGQSPTVSFSLVQSGATLRIQGTREPINVSVPYEVGAASTEGIANASAAAPCVGRPSNEMAAAACSAFLECRWWNASGSGSWSSAGCVTLPSAEGTLTCACDHLTDFVVFEFPSTPEELWEDVISSVQINGLTGEALACLATPYPSKIPFVYFLNGLLLVGGGLALWWAAIRDEQEVRLVEMLIQGRRLEQKRRERMARLASFVPAVSKAAPRAISSFISTRRSSTSVAAGAPLQVDLPSHHRSTADSSAGCPPLVMPASPPTSPPATPQLTVHVSKDDDEGAAAAVPCQLADRADEDAPGTRRNRSSYCGRITARASPNDSSSRAPSYSTFAPILRQASLEEVELSLAELHESSPVTPPPPRPPSVARVLSGGLASLRDSVMEAAVSPVAMQMVSARELVASALGRATPKKRKRWRIHTVAQHHWKVARRQKDHIVLARRWYRSVDRPWKRIWLSFKQTHTLMSGLVFGGQGGFTRAQTVQLLLTSLGIELVVLCMLYSAPSDGPVVINPVKIAVSGCLVAFIVIPCMFLAGALFAPVSILQLLRRCAYLIVCCPCVLARSLARGRLARRRIPVRLSSTCDRTHPPMVASSTPAEASEAMELGAETSSISRHGDWISAREPSDPLGECARRPTPPPTLPTVESQLKGGGGSGKGDECGDKSSPSPSSRTFSYASLDEHMLALSLRRSWRRRDWRNVLSISLGWLASWTLFLSLIFTFSAYGCEFYSVDADPTAGHELLLSWGWSIVQRFLINEPFLILVGKGFPMLVASESCANLCGESVANTVGVIFEILIRIGKELKG